MNPLTEQQRTYGLFSPCWNTTDNLKVGGVSDLNLEPVTARPTKTDWRCGARYVQIKLPTKHIRSGYRHRRYRRIKGPVKRYFRYEERHRTSIWAILWFPHRAQNPLMNVGVVG
ncbi:MAG TPA: hypothetical protein VMW72_10625 [Sedimentisphaerales bacterium]|nr:hypothetical protein [Sedimentisphaerales bacterium]